MDVEPLVETRVATRLIKRRAAACVVVFVVLVVVGGIIAAGLAVGLRRSSDDNPSDGGGGTGGGIITPTSHPSSFHADLATIVRSNMDSSANPCNDFFQYSCGGWLDNNRVPQSGDHKLDRFLQVTISNIKSLRDSIERGDDSNIPAVQLAKKFYDSCMNTEMIESRGARPLLDLVRETGGWNAIGAQNCT